MSYIHVHKRMLTSRAASVTLLLVFTFSLCAAASDRFKTRLDVKSDRIEFKLVRDSLQGTIQISAGDSIQSFIFFQVKLQGGEKIPADRDSVLKEEGTVPVICTLPISMWQCSDSIEIVTFYSNNLPHRETYKLKIIWPEADVKYFAKWDTPGFEIKKDSIIARLRVTPINKCGKPLTIAAQAGSNRLEVIPEKISEASVISITIPPEQTTFGSFGLTFSLGKFSSSTNIPLPGSSEGNGFPRWVVICTLVVAIILIGVFFQKVKQFIQAWPLVFPGVLVIAGLTAIFVYSKEIWTFIETFISNLIANSILFPAIGIFVLFVGLLIVMLWENISSFMLPLYRVRHPWSFRGKQPVESIQKDKGGVKDHSDPLEELVWKTSTIEEKKEKKIHIDHAGPVGVSIECDQQLIPRWYSIFAGYEAEPIKSFPYTVPPSGLDDNQTLTLKFQINKDLLGKRKEYQHRLTLTCRWLPSGSKEIRLRLSYFPDVPPAQPQADKEQEIIEKHEYKKSEPPPKPDGSLDDILPVFQKLLDHPQRVLSLDNPALWEKMYIEPLRQYENIDAKLIGIRNAEEILHQVSPSLIVSEDRKDGSFILVNKRTGLREGYVFPLPYWLYRGEANLRLLDIFYGRPANEGDGYIVMIESPAIVESRGDNFWKILARGKVKFGMLGERSKREADVVKITEPLRPEPLPEIKPALSEERVEAMIAHQIDRLEKHIREVVVEEISGIKPDLSSMVKPITDIADEILKNKLGNIEKSHIVVREEIKKLTQKILQLEKSIGQKEQYAPVGDVDRISGVVKRIEERLDESQQPEGVFRTDNKERLIKQIQDESLTLSDSQEEQEMPDREEAILTFCNERLYEDSSIHPADIIEELKSKFDVIFKLLDKVPGEQTVLKSSERGNFLGILTGRDKAHWMIAPLQFKWTDPIGRGRIRGIYNEQSFGKIAKVEKYAVAEEKEGGILQVVEQGVLMYRS